MLIYLIIVFKNGGGVDLRFKNNKYKQEIIKNMVVLERKCQFDSKVKVYFKILVLVIECWFLSLGCFLGS